MSKYRGIVFDFDDTLVDTGPGKLAAYTRVAKLLLGRQAEDGRLQELIGDIARISEDMNRRREYNRDQWWRRLAGERGLSVTRHLELRATVAYWTSFRRHTQLYPDTLMVLDAIKAMGLPIGLVTDTDGWVGIKRWRLTTSPVFEYFDALVIAGEDTRRTKPDAKPFTLCSDRLGVAPGHLLFVGDKPYTDIVGAKSAGMDAALIKRRNWEDSLGADYVFDSLSPIVGLLA